MKDNFFWPGLVLLVVATCGLISSAAEAAYGRYEWLCTSVLVAVLATIAATLWFAIELRRVTHIDAQWDARADSRCRRAVARGRAAGWLHRD